MLTQEDIKKLSTKIIKDLEKRFVIEPKIHPDDTLTPKEAEQLLKAREEFMHNGSTPWREVKKKLKL